MITKPLNYKYLIEIFCDPVKSLQADDPSCASSNGGLFRSRKCGDILCRIGLSFTDNLSLFQSAKAQRVLLYERG